MLSARAPAIFASFSRLREILLASSRICRSRSLDLRAQLLDARMTVEQRRGLLGQLRAQGDALFAQAAHQLGVQHFGRLDRPARLQHAADQPRLGFGVRLLRPRIAELGVDLAHLLVRQRGVVGADEQARLAAEILDARFGFGDLLAQAIDLAREPLPGGAGLILLGATAASPGTLRRSSLRRAPRVRDRATGIRSRSPATCRSRTPCRRS